MTVSGTDAALADRRLGLRVEGGNVTAFTRDPATGTENIYATAAITPGAVGVALGGLSIDFGLGNYQDGDLAAVDLSSAGLITSGPIVASASADDALVTIGGRYTGDHSFDPGRPWQMQVLQSGTVGSNSNPPLVQFTWYSGSDTVRVREDVTLALDGSMPAGTQIPIGDGVFATFASGTLTASPNGAVDIMVDGQPDAAGILPSLGMNSLFTGTDAASFQVNDNVAKNADLLAVARTRSAGDNSNLLALGGT